MHIFVSVMLLKSRNVLYLRHFTVQSFLETTQISHSAAFTSMKQSHFAQASYSTARNPRSTRSNTIHWSAPAYSLSGNKKRIRTAVPCFCINSSVSIFLHISKKVNLSGIASSAQRRRKFARDTGSMISLHFFIRISLYLSRILSVVRPF